MARVLIVDDDEEDRLLQRHILEAGGHELYFAKNGEEAMRLFMRRTPDVVVTDLKMPGGDGIELIEALVGMFPDVKVIAITGASAEMLDMATLMGALVTLTKPVSPRTLLDAVAEVLVARN